MSFESGRSTAHFRSDAAVLRGGAAGSISGALAVAAHGWASGAAVPDSNAVTLLIAGSAVVGALTAGVGALRTTALGLVAALVGGQLLGHLSMSWSGGGGHHHHQSLWTPSMLAAHVVGAIVAAVLILGAEAAYRITTTVLARVLPAPVVLPVRSGPPALPIEHRDRVVLRIFAADTFRTRGPPVLVRG
ncbi:hypothetical protein HLB23_06700 [Nocardia uniformis]|uniref:Uncharacterized protein n=1 Tax=Nocardia uniformis TaxID=53432 RepID=A0A849C3L2_9NOCA|nr:hypothetical protein [Nocardia uniformis]NNH69559.1 hypothetical protein [Nocardia uniformis]